MSLDTRREMVDCYGVNPARVIVVPNGVHPRFQVPRGFDAKQWRTSKGLAKGYALYVGSFEAKKNLPRLLRAWRRLVNDGRSGGRVLALAGGRGGQGFDIERAIVDAGVAKAVRVLGHLPDDDLPSAMAAADVFVYPSLYEGFGLPVLEAMACGAPVVTSSTSSLGEVAGDAALTIDPENEQALADAIGQVLNDPILADRLCSSGRERVRQFSVDACARKTLAVYREVLAL